MKITYFKDAKLGITGASGYIGSSLTNEYFKLFSASIIDLSECPEDATLVHLASRVGNFDSASAISNVSMDINVFDQCQRGNVKLIYASSNNVYPLKISCSVNEPVLPTDWYSWSKVSAEKAIGLTKYTFPARVLRIADVFGPRQRHGNFFMAIEQSVNNKSPFTFNPSAHKIRSYIFIEELINVIQHLVKDSWLDKVTLNICHKSSLSLVEIIDQLQSMGLDTDIAKKESQNIPIDARTMIQSEIKGYTYKLDLTKALGVYWDLISSTP